MTSERKVKKWVRCKIKNIASLHRNEITETPFTYLEFLDTLPNNCIRLRSAMGWCYMSCEDAVCRECEHEQ